MKRYFFIWFVFILLCLSPSAWAANWLPAGLNWETIETPHFKIHYYTEIKDIALNFAPIAEQVHERLSKFYHHEVEMKTHVVLTDNVDYGNGMASVVGEPTVVLYVTPWLTNANPYRFDYWLKFVFVHEYAHILTLDYVPPELEGAKQLTGRIFFPNLLLPKYMVEGISVYTESYFDKGGRTSDPRWEQMIRMDLLQGKVHSADQAANYIPDWPMGNLPYLYGGEFLEYIANIYGIEKYIELENNFAIYLLSTGMDGDFRAVLGKPFAEVWNDWLQVRKVKYEAFKATVEAEGILEGRRVTVGGYDSFKPKWDKESKYIYYLSNSAHRYPDMRRVNSETGQDEEVFQAQVESENYSFDKSFENLIVSRGIYYDNFYYYKDLFAFNLKGQKWFQLTRKERASDPAVSPDNKHIVYIKNGGGERNLKILDVKEDGGVEIKETGLTGLYFSPVWAPDGKSIVVSKKEGYGAYNLYQISYPELKPTPIMQCKELIANVNPCFTADGKYILFDSDVTGVVNIYAYELEKKKFHKVTNVFDGATMPDVSPDGKKIAYVSYSPAGYDVSVMDFKPETWKKPSFDKAYEYIATSEPLVIDYDKRVPDLKVSGYDPTSSLVPKFWLPFLFLSSNGSYLSFTTASQDPLLWNQMQLAFSYDSRIARPIYSFVYANNQFWPQFSLQLDDLAIPYYSANGSITWQREISQGFYTTFYNRAVFREDDMQSFSVGYAQNLAQSVSNDQGYPIDTDQRAFRGPVLMWQYAGARQYPYSVCKEDGLDLNFKAEVFEKQFGSQYDLNRQSLYLDYYKPVPFTFHNVVALDLFGFTSSGEDLFSGKVYGVAVPIKGYAAGALGGFRGNLATLQYALPIWYVNRGSSEGALFFRQFWGKVFYQQGGASYQLSGDLTTKRSMGFEVTLDMIFSAIFNPSFTFGYAQGWDAGGERKTYFQIVI
ncbi:MAG: hypothetical protein NT099_09210 [Candidatus Saganbacteria bacterium]|nr:hypothetical protein [Candidatus Saganbacteria bacterium]